MFNEALTEDRIDRYDVIWTFALDPVAQRYVFGQVPQQLLDGDSNTVI